MPGAAALPCPPGASLDIVITSPFVWPWVRRGSERMLHDLSRYLVGRGHRVTVFSTGPKDDVERRDGIAYHLFRQRFGTRFRQFNCCHDFAFRLAAGAGRDRSRHRLQHELLRRVCGDPGPAALGRPIPRRVPLGGHPHAEALPRGSPGCLVLPRGAPAGEPHARGEPCGGRRCTGANSGSTPSCCIRPSWWRISPRRRMPARRRLPRIHASSSPATPTIAARARARCAGPSRSSRSAIRGRGCSSPGARARRRARRCSPRRRSRRRRTTWHSWAWERSRTFRRFTKGPRSPCSLPWRRPSASCWPNRWRRERRSSARGTGASRRSSTTSSSAASSIPAPTTGRRTISAAWPRLSWRCSTAARLPRWWRPAGRRRSDTAGRCSARNTSASCWSWRRGRSDAPGAVGPGE